MREPPIYHIILPALSGYLLFPGSAPHSVRRWYRRPEGSAFHRFLYPLFPVLRYVSRFFSVHFPAFVSGPVLLLLLPGQLAFGNRLFRYWSLCLAQSGGVFFSQFFFFLQIIVIITNIIYYSAVCQLQNPGGRLVDKVPS